MAKLPIISSANTNSGPVKTKSQTGLTYDPDTETLETPNATISALGTGIVHSDSDGNLTSSGVTVAEGGTGLSSIQEGSLLIGGAANTMQEFRGTVNDQVVKWDNTTGVWYAGTGGGGGGVESISGTSPITVDNTDPANPIVEIDQTSIGIDHTQVSGLGDLALKSTISNTDVASDAAIARSKLAAGTAGHVVINDPSTGAMSSEAQLAVSRGGTGLSSPNGYLKGDGAGNVTADYQLDDLTGTLGTPDILAFDTTPTTALSAAGQVRWSDDARIGSLQLRMIGGNVDSTIGQTLHQKCYNGTGSALSKGQVVYVSGAQGDQVAVSLAQANSDSTSATIIGVVAESISTGQSGFIITEGLLTGVSDLSTGSGFTAGQPIYLSPTTPGALTPTKPVAPQHLVLVGYCVKTSNGSAGEMLIKVQNGYELGELHDVYINGKATNQLLKYNGTVWTNGLGVIASIDGLQSTLDAKASTSYVDTQDAATLSSANAYAEGLAYNISSKAPVHVTTTVALPSYTFSGNVLTATVNGALTDTYTDGHTLELNQRLLVKDEAGANQKYNGIYYLSQVGDGSNPWKLTRSTDADTAGELCGANVPVETGSTNAGTLWIFSANSSTFVINTDPVIWNALSATIPDATTSIKGKIQLAGAFHSTSTAALPVIDLTATTYLSGTLGYSKLSLTGSIVDADISASAAIARSKIAAGTTHTLVVNNGTGLLSELAPGTSGYVLKSNGTGNAFSWVDVSGLFPQALGTTDSPTFAGLTLSSPLTVGNGGTGLSTLTSGSYLVGNGAGNVTLKTATQVTADLDLFATNATTKGLVPGSNSVGATYFLCADGTWAVPAGGGSGTVTDVSTSGGTTGLTLTTTNPTTTPSITLGGTLAAANGGTGLTSYTVGDILYASGSAELSKLIGVATGNVLISGGVATAPSWGKVGLTTHVSGTLGVTNGGTGITSIASGQILYASGANTLTAGTLSSLNWTSVVPNSSILMRPGTLSSATLSGGNSSSSTTAGAVIITAGVNSSTGAGGTANVNGGNALSGNGGAAFLLGGLTQTGTGGAVYMRGGLATSSGTGGSAYVDGGYSALTSGSAVLIGTQNSTPYRTNSVTIGRSGITTTMDGTVNVSGLTASQYVKTDASKNLVSAATIPATDVTGIPYDIIQSTVGTYNNDEVVFRFVAKRAITLSSTASDHSFKSLTASTGTVTVLVKAGATTLLSVSFAASSTGTVTVSSTSISVGDEVTVVMPSTADATLAGVYFTITGSV